MKAIERADVALLLIDATTGITAQDAHIAGFILEAKKSCVVLVNKWDAVEKDTFTMLEFTEKIRQDLNFMDYVPLIIHLCQNRAAGGSGNAIGATGARGTTGAAYHFID